MTAALAVCCGLAAFAITEAAAGCRQTDPHPTRRCGEQPSGMLRSLESLGGCFEIEVQAASRWNASGVRLEKGGEYAFEVISGADGKSPPLWYDATLPATAEGWTKDAYDTVAKSPIFSAFVDATRWLRRAPKSEWFYLMGMVAEVGERSFPIGAKATAKMETGGEFCAFANDLPWKYDNNKGSLRLRVTRADK